MQGQQQAEAATAGCRGSNSRMQRQLQPRVILEIYPMPHSSDSGLPLADTPSHCRSALVVAGCDTNGIVVGKQLGVGCFAQIERVVFGGDAEGLVDFKLNRKSVTVLIKAACAVMSCHSRIAATNST